MRLNQIVEGWGLQPGAINPADVPGILAGRSPQQELQKKVGEKFRYSPEDELSDFIKVVPFNRSKQLNALPQSKHALSSFAGSKIYYGFKFAPGHEYNDQFVSGLVSNSTARKQLRSQSQAYMSRIVEIDQQSKFLNPKKNPWDQDTLDDWEAERIGLLAKAQELRQYMDRPGTEWEASKDLLQKADAILDKYYRFLQLSFVHLLKDPQTETGKQLRDQFIEMAAANFASQIGDGGYDIITYPESSSPFNILLATELANHVGGKVVPVGYVKKLAGNVTVNQAELQRRFDDSYLDAQRQQNLDNPKNKRYETDAEREGRKLRDDIAGQDPTKPLQIKSMIWKDKRRYMDMFEKSKRAPSLGGKRVLIVDDNVDNSNTFELVQALAQTEQPAKLDLYSPLYIGGAGFPITQPKQAKAPKARPKFNPYAPESFIRRMRLV